MNTHMINSLIHQYLIKACFSLLSRQCRQFRSFVVNFEPISHFCSSVSIANFEQVNVGWVLCLINANQRATFKILVTHF